MAYFIRTRTITGLTLIFLGLLFITNNYGIIIIPKELLKWEYFFIIIGFLLFTVSNNKIAGSILIALGLFNLLPDLWPLILVLVGLYIILKRNQNEEIHRKFNKQTINQLKNNLYSTDNSTKENFKATKELIEEIVIFGGSRKIFHSNNFRGGHIISIFGSLDINLIDCNLAEDVNILEITAIFGGLTITAPTNWKIQIDILPIFGSCNDKRIKSLNSQSEEGNTLIIKGFVLFGGCEIKSNL
ncbi:MAG: LiaF-related protein [Melioribacter sp.]|nr:LiaF-related protein [Melioribacter sp.]